MRENGVRPEERQRIVALYRQGHSGLAIAPLVGRGVTTVHRVLRQEGIDPAEMARARGRAHPKQRFSDEEERAIVREYVDGAALSQLAKARDTNLTTIYDILRRRNVPRRPRGGRERQFSREQVAEMARRWRAGESQTQIAGAFNTSQTNVSKWLQFYGETPTPRPPVMDRHGKWNGGRTLAPGGYVQVKIGADHPFAAMRNTGGYVLEHRLIMATLLGRALFDHETVHHIDGNHQNNDPANLQLRHAPHGKGVVLVCADCGSHNIIARELDTHDTEATEPLTTSGKGSDGDLRLQ